MSNVPIDNNSVTAAVGDSRRFLIAGLGGIAPVLLNLIVVDLQTLLLRLTLLAVLSYMIKVIALFFLGGLIGWLYRSENDYRKLFQLGVAAPALITAAINGGHIALPETGGGKPEQTASLLVSRAYAQEDGARPTPSLKSFSYPAETPAQQIYRGLFGSVSQNVWYVIAGSYPKVDLAEREAAKIRKRGFDAEVYMPYGETKYYAVVIGAQLTRDKAQALQRKAVSSGLRNDTYLWTFPRE